MTLIQWSRYFTADGHAELSADRVGVRVVVESVEWGCGLDGPDLWLPFFWTVSAKAEDAVSQKEDHLRSAYSFLRHKHLKADRGKYQKQHEWQMLGGSSIYLTYPNLLCCPIARNSEHTQNTIRAHSENTQRALWKYSPHLQSVPSSAGRNSYTISYSDIGERTMILVCFTMVQTLLSKLVSGWSVHCSFSLFRDSTWEQKLARHHNIFLC